MESEHLQNFNDRLSQWVSSQGFWFQLRYSLSGSGSGGNVVFQLMKLGARVLVFLLVVALGLAVYLTRRTGTEGFSEKVKVSLKTALNASEIEMRGLSHVRGDLGINGLAAKGENGTFFSALEARNIRCRMSVLDGLMGKWDPGTISISRLNLDLQAGADDADAARKLADSLFNEIGAVKLGTVEVADATLNWGYGKSIAPKSLDLANPSPQLMEGYEFEHTKGSISHSFMRIQHLGESLRLSFRGGKFSQNWLRNLDIVDMEVVCDRNGIRFERAIFRRLQGTVDFSGLSVVGGERPLISGTAAIRNLSLGAVLPPSARSFLEGTLSGDFGVSGSTNSSEGIVFEGDVAINTPDMISLRQQLHLLKALSVVDFSRNYHRIDFREGSFHMKTSSGGLELTDVHLKSDDPITLDGSVSVRLPSYEEMVDYQEKGGSVGSVPMFDSGDADLEALEMSNEDDFNLRRAAEETSRADDKTAKLEGGSLFGQLDDGMNIRRFSDQTSENLTRTLRYHGKFTIGLPADAFERAPKLAERFPLDPAARRIPVDVPLEGTIYEITVKQAEQIYQEGRR